MYFYSASSGIFLFCYPLKIFILLSCTAFFSSGAASSIKRILKNGKYVRHKSAGMLYYRSLEKKNRKVNLL